MPRRYANNHPPFVRRYLLVNRRSSAELSARVRSTLTHLQTHGAPKHINETRRVSDRSRPCCAHLVFYIGANTFFQSQLRHRFRCRAGGVVVRAAAWRGKGRVVHALRVADGRPAVWAQGRVAARGGAQELEGRLRHRARGWGVSRRRLFVLVIAVGSGGLATPCNTTHKYARAHDAHCPCRYVSASNRASKFLSGVDILKVSCCSNYN